MIRRAGIVTATAAALAAAGLAGWGRATRATQAERRAALPGDDEVPRPRWQLTRAVTIARPPGDVWPWIVQMGHPSRRAGWYAPYWLDRFVWRIRERSADRIVPELQGLAVGDRVPDSIDGTAWFTVERLDPGRAVVLLLTTHPLPVYTDARFSWAFALEDRGVSTRLLVRARMDFTPVWPPPLAWLFFRVVMTLGDLVEAGAMLRGVRARVEGRGALRPSG